MSDGIKNKDIFETLEEARQEYWKQRLEQNLYISFESWLFKDVEPREAAEHDPKEEGCGNCRYYLSLAGIPFFDMRGRCLLNFGVPTGTCDRWEPEGKQEPSCYSCRHGLQGGDHNCLCLKGWVRQEDDNNCDEWEEAK